MDESKKDLNKEIQKKKEHIKSLKKLLFISIIIPVVPLVILLTILFSNSVKFSDITVDQRFALSQSMKSPYTDTAKGSYMYSFVFCGDPHMDSDGDTVFPQLDKYIKANQVSFAVFPGDLTLSGKESQYKNFINHANQLTVPTYQGLGSTDLYNNGWEDYWKFIGPSAYSFYGGNAKFIVIDTASGDIGAKQMEWIQTELKENKQPLLIVVSYMPIYGGSQAGYEFPKSQERTQLIAMFEKYDVDYVLEGHYHGYVDITVNGVRYITSGSFNETLLDSGTRHFLAFKVYGPNVTIEKIPVTSDVPIEYRDNAI